MKGLLVEVDRSDSRALLELAQYYAYDFSDLLALDVDVTGRFGVAHLQRHFDDPVCHPFTIVVDGKLAGFALHEGRSRLSGEVGVNDVAEFFVMKKYRRRGVGAAAARELFDRFTGRWEVRQVRTNTAAIAFWRKTIGDYTGGAFTETTQDDDRFRGTVQRFKR